MLVGGAIASAVTIIGAVIGFTERGRAAWRRWVKRRRPWPYPALRIVDEPRAFWWTSASDGVYVEGRWRVTSVADKRAEVVRIYVRAGRKRLEEWVTHWDPVHGPTVGGRPVGPDTYDSLSYQATFGPLPNSAGTRERLRARVVVVDNFGNEYRRKCEFVRREAAVAIEDDGDAAAPDEASPA